MTSSSDVVSAVEERFYEEMQSFGYDASELVREAQLEELDVDSLDVAELAQLFNEEYGMSLHPRDFRGLTTIGEVLDVISSRASSAVSASA